MTNEITHHPRIIVEVEGGCVTCIYGDPLPITVDFIVRDLDNIKEDPTTDPMKGETIENPVIHY